MPDRKRFTVDFYTSRIHGDEPLPKVWDLLQGFVERGGGPARQIKSGRGFELREIHGSNTGKTVWGVVAKLRDEDLPHVGVPGGPEREIDMDEEERLLEKNYFLFNKDWNLMVYQRNGHAATAQQFAGYLTECCSHTIALDPVLQPEPTRRLLRQGVEPKSLELSVTAPKNRDLFPNTRFAREMLEMLQAGGGHRLSITMTPGRTGPVSERKIHNRVKRAVSELVEQDVATKARLQVWEEGVEHPIDLITDRLYSQHEVPMDGHYPAPEAMYAALDSALSQNRDSIVEILGEPGRALE